MDGTPNKFSRVPYTEWKGGVFACHSVTQSCFADFSISRASIQSLVSLVSGLLEKELSWPQRLVYQVLDFGFREVTEGTPNNRSQLKRVVLGL